MQPRSCWVEGNNHFTWHAGCTLGNAASCTASLRHYRGTHSLHAHSCCHPPQLPTPFLHWCYPDIWSPACADNGVIPTQGQIQIFAFAFAEPQEVPLSPPLLRFLWSADLPFHVSTTYPPVFAIWKTGCILFWCLGLKMLNSISPMINPKKHLASCQLDFNPLTTLPCAPAKPPSFSPTLQFTHPLWTSSVWLGWEIESLEIIMAESAGM